MNIQTVAEFVCSQEVYEQVQNIGIDFSRGRDTQSGKSEYNFYGSYYAKNERYGGLARDKKTSPEAIIVMVTADRQKETKKELIAAGATNVLNKPVDKDELREICAKIAFGG